MNDRDCPRRILGFLRWFCPAHLVEEIEGDLLQKFNRDVARFGKGRASYRLMWNMIRFFRPGIVLRNRFSFELNKVYMVLAHLKFATRLFVKDKFFSTLNILGLALGITVGIVLLLILQNNLTYDRHHLNYQNIYRVGCHQQQTGLEIRWARSAMDLGTVLQAELPEIRSIVRIDDGYGRQLVKYEKGVNQKAYYEEGVMAADSTYFQVFTHRFIAGEPSTCLNRAFSAVVTETIARKYFGSDDPLGKSLIMGGEAWMITGVIADIPDNTHLKFDILTSNRQSLVTNVKIESENFWNPGVYLYIMVPDGYNPRDFYTKFPDIFDKYFKSFGAEVGGKYTPVLEALADIHFYSDLDQDEPRGNLAYVYGFTAVGILIMVLACINYMNLSTAKAINRVKEIAVKRLSGSGTSLLVISFLGEAILLSLASLIVAIVLTHVLLGIPAFNNMIGMTVELDFLHNRLLLFGSLGIALGIGIVSGLYPAFYLPSLPMLTILKGAFKNRRSSHQFRKTLITLQFAISIFVSVCTLFMGDQIDYVRQKDLGFSKDNILIIPLQDSLVNSRVSVIRTELLRDPRIKAAAVADNVVGFNVGGVRNFWVESEAGMKQIGFTTIFVGDDYLQTMGMKIVDGNDFQPGPGIGGETSYILNEAAATLTGWGPNVVGKRMKFFHGEIPGHVIGVVKDFNFQSLHNAVDPLLIIKVDGASGFLHLKLDVENLTETISSIRVRWKQYDPDHPFEYFFLDQRFNDQYKADEAQNELLSLLSWVTVFISLLGVIGLSAFDAGQRTKEIGIRKVLGATVPQIVLLLSRDALILVLLSSLIIFPLSYWVIHSWLDNFAYKTLLDYSTYFIVTGAALCFVFLTVLFQSLKTVRSNPVDSLKYE